MPGQPAQFNRAGERDAVLIRCAARVEEGLVNQFNVDAAFLHGLNRVGQLCQPSGGGIGISERALCVRLVLPKVKAEFCPIDMSKVYNFIAT
jgi:hypothetical protein